MSALVERIIAARDRLRGFAVPSDDDIIEARDAMADAANALTDSLAALKLAADWMGEWNRPASVMDTIRAAIAKAEGRS